MLSKSIQGEVHFATRIPGFFIGICIAILITEGFLKIKLSIGLCALIIVQIDLMFYRGIPSFNYPIAGFLLIIIYLKCVLLFNHFKVFAYLRWIFRKMGKYSYEIYLTHFFIMITFNQYILNYIGMANIGRRYLLILVILYFLITIVISKLINMLTKILSLNIINKD
ncbi:hypothetical protein AK964_13110 [Clostridium butyricum]|nr:hypothetical protein AK964_13110 [Clostridium butyricum]